nr:MAG TPA: hypothetical protein [Caudoviricetes sp.]
MGRLGTGTKRDVQDSRGGGNGEHEHARLRPDPRIGTAGNWNQT